MGLSLAFRPKLVESLRSYTRDDFRADLVAGVTVGLVALPLGMALAIATGLKPEVGIVTAIVGGLIVAALGGSRVQIGGPAGALISILAPIVATHGPEGLVVCTLLAGVMLLGMGLAGMGTLIKFIPYPVVSGFTSGIAILILSTQINDFFGLGLAGLSAHFLPKLKTIVLNFHPSIAATVLAVVCTAVILTWPAKWGRRVPGSMIAIVLSGCAARFFGLHEHFGIETIQSKFGGISGTIPLPDWPGLTLEAWPGLMRDAFTIAILGAIESLLCAVVADGMIDDRHDSNQELVAQGIANISAAFFGGMAATGVIARTATNVRSGARTPVAGITHAITLLIILLAAAPLAGHIPLAALAAVLVVVALRMGEWSEFALLPKWPRSDAIVFLVAFVLTVIADLTLAVGAAMLLAALFLIKRISETTQVTADEEVTQGNAPGQTTRGRTIPEGVLVFRVFGAFFFGAADKLESTLRAAGGQPQVLILRMRDVLALDATGLTALEDLLAKQRAKHKHLILCGPHTQPFMALHNAGFFDKLGDKNLCADMDSALARARELIETKTSA
jgi:SulP family sulfate permease